MYLIFNILLKKYRNKRNTMLYHILRSLKRWNIISSFLQLNINKKSTLEHKLASTLANGLMKTA